MYLYELLCRRNPADLKKRNPSLSKYVLYLDMSGEDTFNDLRIIHTPFGDTGVDNVALEDGWCSRTMTPDFIVTPHERVASNKENSPFEVVQSELRP